MYYILLGLVLIWKPVMNLIRSYYTSSPKRWVHFSFRGTNYKILIEQNLYPSPGILFARNEHGEDITDEIRQLAGPNENFRYEIRPYQLGYDNVIIDTLNGEIEFAHDQVLML